MNYYMQKLEWVSERVSEWIIKFYAPTDTQAYINVEQYDTASFTRPLLVIIIIVAHNLKTSSFNLPSFHWYT